MNLKSQLSQARTHDLTVDERLQLCCRIAKNLERVGDYEGACEALADFWPNRNSAPVLEELNEINKGTLFLRAGALAGWLVSADQTEGDQETAKNLLTKSIEIFHAINQPTILAEA